MSTRELMMSFYSVCGWNSPTAWSEYLCALELLLDDRLVKLDTNDPARRNVSAAKDEGAFVVQFGDHEDSRWLWGKFAKTKIDISIQFYKARADSYGRLRSNLVEFYIPESMAFDHGITKLIDVFTVTNASLEIFYAYCDFADVICKKTPSTQSLDISCELLGVFWMTYFGSRYCDFFSRSRLLSLVGATAGPAGGITVRLAGEPGQSGSEIRAAAESKLGELSFVGYGGIKAQGQFALTLANL